MSINPLVRFSHSHHLLAVKGYDGTLDILAFEGKEALSRPFSYRVEFTSGDHQITREMMLMKPASLTLQAPINQGFGIKLQHPVRVIQGVVIVAGGLQTWKMLEALGRVDLMPGYTAEQYNKQAENKDNPLRPENIQPQQIPGLRCHICTLVSQNSVPGKPERTYVHSKLMMVDDVFMIQGSANINLRSMLFDSESAIAIQDTDHSNIIPAMRNQLWGLHTNNRAGCRGSDYEGIFDAWDKLLNENTQLWKESQGLPLMSSVIKFIDHSTKLQDKD